VRYQLAREAILYRLARETGCKSRLSAPELRSILFANGFRVTGNVCLSYSVPQAAATGVPELRQYAKLIRAEKCFKADDEN
jgi:hypothetical protein